MNIIEVALLATIQGFAEFLPISSSLHIFLSEKVFHIWFSANDAQKDAGFSIIIDTVLHCGSFLALCIYFRKYLMNLVSGFFARDHYRAEPTIYQLFLSTLIVSSVGLVSYLYVGNGKGYSLISSNALALYNAISAVVLYMAFRFSKQYYKFRASKNLTSLDAVLVGFAQLLALIPCVSRLGAAIACLLILGYKLQDAVKFGLIFGAPVLFAAFILKFFSYRAVIFDDAWNLIAIGMVISCIVGIMTISAAVKFLESNRSMAITLIYRMIISVMLMLFI